MVLTRDHRPLRLAYIEDSPTDAQALLKSWEDYRPRLQNEMDHYPSAEAYLTAQQAPFAPHYDLLFIDLHLPGVQGDELVRIIRGQPEYQQQGILVVTASDEWIAQTVATASQADGWAVKPLRAAGILHELGKISNRYGIEIIDLAPPPLPSYTPAAAT